jgi:hypothetical protein
LWKRAAEPPFYFVFQRVRRLVCGHIRGRPVGPFLWIKGCFLWKTGLFWGEGASDQRLFAKYSTFFENVCSKLKNRPFYCPSSLYTGFPRGLFLDQAAFCFL